MSKSDKILDGFFTILVFIIVVCFVLGVVGGFWYFVTSVI